MTKIAWGPDSPEYDGKCPVPPGTDCTVWFRNGLSERDNEPEDWGYWRDHARQNRHPLHDIIAYEVHDAPDQARELLAEARDALKYLPIRNERSKQCAARIDAYLKGAD